MQASLAASNIVHPWNRKKLARATSGVSSVSTSTAGSEPSSGTCSEDEQPLLARHQTFSAAKGPHVNTEYPNDLVIYNTFLEFVDEETFLDPRQIRSAPSSPLSRIRKTETTDFEFGCSQGFGVSTPSSSSSDAPVFDATLLANVHSVHHMSTVTAPAARPAVLELATLVTEPIVGSIEAPTFGSLRHSSGNCKPCAFFWKSTGCGNGINCPFCHLCDAGERKLRQKHKKAALRGMTGPYQD